MSNRTTPAQNDGWMYASVFCPKCRHRKRARMSPLRLFGTVKCDHCKHRWIPARKERETA